MSSADPKVREEKTRARFAILGALSKVLIALLVLVFSALYFLLATTAGSRFTADKIEAFEPRLQLKIGEGDLFSGLDIQTLVWTDDDLHIEVIGILSEWRSDCLWQKAFCIESISAQTLIVNMIDKGPAPVSASDKQAIVLPAVDLPISLFLQSLNINNLLLQNNGAQSLVLENLIAKQMSLVNSEFKLGQLALFHEKRELSLTGRIHLHKNYPLDLTFSSDLPQQLPPVILSLSGELTDLTVASRGWGDYPVQFKGAANLLDPKLPFEASLEIYESLEYIAKDFTALILTGGVKLSGQLDDVELGAEFNLSHSMWEGDHDVNIQAHISSAGVDSLHLLAKLPMARIESHAAISFGEGFASQAEILVSKFNPMLFQPEAERDKRLQGDIDAKLNVHFSSVAQEPEISVGITSLSGVFAGRDVQGRGEINYRDKMLGARDLYLKLSDSYIRANTEYADDSKGHLTWQTHVPDLAKIWRRGAGSVEASGILSGEVSKPDIKISAVMQGISWDDYRLDKGQFTLDVSGDDGNKSRVDIELTALQVLPGQSPVNATFHSAGTNLHQALSLSVNAESIGDFNLNCDVEMVLSRKDFVSVCQNIDLNFPQFTQHGFAHWSLVQPLKLSLDLQQQAGSLGPVDLGGLCFANSQDETQSVCSEQTISWSADAYSSAAIKGKNIPLAPFASLLDKMLTVSGDTDFSLFNPSFKVGETPTIEANLAASNIGLAWQTDNSKELRFTIDRLDAQAHLNDGDVAASLRLDSKQLGAIEGELNRVDGLLEASLRSAGLDLSPLVIFIPAARQFSATLVTDLSLKQDAKGTQIEGGITVLDGKADIIGTPLPIDGFELGADFTGWQAELSGKINTTGGRIDLLGQADWSSNDWSLLTKIVSKDLLVHPIYGTDIYLGTDLLIEVAPKKIRLTGDVTIPKARINIRELPPSAIKPSGDTVLVSQGNEKVAEAWVINTDVNLHLIDDVQFRGFGLYSELTGNLRLSQEGQKPLSTMGVISLIDGRYKAYGQDLLIKEGRMVFTGLLENPDILLKAERNNRDQSDLTVGVLVDGELSKPEVSIYSTPAMSETAKLHVLLTGRMPNESAENQGSMLSMAAMSSGLKATNERAGKVASALGIDDFTLGADTGDSGQEAQMSGYLGPNLYLKYGYSIFEQTQEYTARYKLSEKLFVEGKSGKTSAVDLLWRIEREAAVVEEESPAP